MSGQRHITWPADRFYWGVIDTSVLPRHRRRSPEHCGFLFESELPIALDVVHAVFTPIGDDRMLGCAIERDAIERDVDPVVRTLVPDGVPARVLDDSDGKSNSHARRLNLLTGDYEPPASRRAGRRVTASVLIGVIATSVFLTVGFWRRGEAMNTARAAVMADVRTTVSDALGREIREDPGALSAADLELVSRVEQLRHTRDEKTADNEVFDAGAMLSSILAVWPDEPVQVQSVVVARDAIRITGRVTDPLIPPRVTTALAGLPDWKTRLADSTQQTNNVWNVEWRMERVGGGT